MQQQMSLGELCYPVPLSFEPAKSFFKGLVEAMQSILQTPLDVRLKESKSLRGQPCVLNSPSALSPRDNGKDPNGDLSHTFSTQRPLAGRSRTPGPRPHPPFRLHLLPFLRPCPASHKYTAVLLPLSRSRDSDTLYICLLWAPCWSSQLSLLPLLCLAKSHHPCSEPRALTWESFPHQPGLALLAISPSAFTSSRPWPISCLGLCMRWIHEPLPAPHKCRKGKNHYESCSEVPEGPGIKQMLRNTFFPFIYLCSYDSLRTFTEPLFSVSNAGYKTKVLQGVHCSGRKSCRTVCQR